MLITSPKPNLVIRSAYAEKKRIQPDLSGVSRTKQQFKDECDINVIISRFLRTGHLDVLQRLEPRYGDVTGLDFINAMNTVARAQTLFNELPAEIRNRFENQPAKFLDFVQDEKNRPEAEELGLLKKVTKIDQGPTAAPTTAPLKADATPPATSTGTAPAAS